MNEQEFKDMCKKGLQKAIDDNDGWSAHFYGKMLLGGIIVNPTPKYYYCKWID